MKNISLILIVASGISIVAQAQIVDSTGVQRSFRTISPSTGDTGTYTPPPPQVVQPTPQSATNISWTMYLKDTQRCASIIGCVKIDGDGNLLHINPMANSGVDQLPFPVGSNPLVTSVTNCGDYPSYQYTFKPIVDPRTGNYLDWTMEAANLQSPPCI